MLQVWNTIKDLVLPRKMAKILFLSKKGQIWHYKGQKGQKGQKTMTQG